MITLYFFRSSGWLFGSLSDCLLFWEFGCSLLTILFHKDDYNYRAVGAPQAGVLYSAILLQPDMMLGIFFINLYASLSFGTSIYCILFME
jgi:hypothetical protein